MNDHTVGRRPRGGMNRRGFLVTVGATAVGAALATTLPEKARAAAGTFRVPVEDVRHTRTWMAWPDSTAIWPGKLSGVQVDIALIARTIAKYEPVVMCANSGSAAKARQMCGPTVTVISSIPVDDCWMRDSGPVFRTDGSGGLDTVGLNFNGWGNKQTHAKDALVAERVAAYVGVPFTYADLVGEGGAIEQDGAGTLMATRSSLVNRNRNPGMSERQIESAMCDAYGASKVIWFDGVYGQDITDDHVDATSRFLAPGEALVQMPVAADTDAYARDARLQYGKLSASTTAERSRPGRHTAPGPGLQQDPIRQPGLPGLLRQLLPLQRRRHQRPVRRPAGGRGRQGDPGPPLPGPCHRAARHRPPGHGRRRHPLRHPAAARPLAGPAAASTENSVNEACPKR